MFYAGIISPEGTAEFDQWGSGRSYMIHPSLAGLGLLNAEPNVENVGLLSIVAPDGNRSCCSFCRASGRRRTRPVPQNYGLVSVIMHVVRLWPAKLV
jgi:hypothetical protein